MPTNTLFPIESPVAQRQPKTDRLILEERFLKPAANDKRLDDSTLRDAHAILVRWADLDTSGRLAELNETQMQGDFLAEVFGQALGYAGPLDNQEVWHYVQHPHIGDQTPDAALGFFRQGEPLNPLGVVELKGPTIHLDRRGSSGRTPVDQCWDYLINTPPTCRWGVVSNYVSFRLYERGSTKRVYEHFSLQSLRDFEIFKQFYVLFHRTGLIEKRWYDTPTAVALLDQSRHRQRTVGDELYDAYSKNRTDLIAELHFKQKHPLDLAMEMAQRLLDRIIFIAFCEDRRLLPPETIPKAWTVAGFHAVTNPRWQNFKNLFRFIDNGEVAYDIPRYNGGLFAQHSVDDIELPDKPWADFFKSISGYDFTDEVNLDVLGHLFERSITEIEKLKEHGLFGGNAQKTREYATMPQSAKRKQLGIYYTPPELTSRIVQYTVDELIAERFADVAIELGVPEEEARRGVAPDDPRYWQRCFDILRNLKIVDPACGSGAFLFQAYDILESRYHEVLDHLDTQARSASEGNVRDNTQTRSVSEGPASLETQARSASEGKPAKTTETAPIAAKRNPKSKIPNPKSPSPNLQSAISNPQFSKYASVPTYILQDNLYGVDLSPEAVEITQLALWIRSAAPGQLLAKLADNIIHGNSLVHDAAIHPDGFHWRERFPAVFHRPQAGFDCVIGNPPWERIKLQEREFFSLPAPEIATATNAAKRRQLVAKLETDDPALYGRYQEALAAADSLLTYCRQSDEYPLTGRGDINTYAVFAELAYNIVAPHGRVGLLVPSGIASDMTTKDFFAAVAESNRLIRLYDFENRLKKFFPDIDNRFKFSILNFAGQQATASKADYVFFTHRVEELADKTRHIALSAADIRLLNPNTRTCPIFRTRRDAEITKAIYRRVPVLIDENRKGPTGNPWGIKFKTMFHQTNDAELFREADALKKDGYKLKGNCWVKGKTIFLPLYEAKMLQDFDHRAADVVTDDANWVRQGQTAKRSLVGYQNPEELAMPRFWVESANVEVADWGAVGFKDITSPTNQRTMIAACAPRAAFTNHFVLVGSDAATRRQMCLLANLNSFAYDFVTRQKIGGVTLNFFIVEQVPTLPPDTYQKPCPWDHRTPLETWISERVLKLTCTAEDMLPLAEACDFQSGSFQKEYGGRLNKWDEDERMQLMAELDGLFAHLYGLSEEDFLYILTTFTGVPDPIRIACGNAFRDVANGFVK